MHPAGCILTASSLHRPPQLTFLRAGLCVLHSLSSTPLPAQPMEEPGPLQGLGVRIRWGFSLTETMKLFSFAPGSERSTVGNPRSSSRTCHYRQAARKCGHQRCRCRGLHGGEGPSWKEERRAPEGGQRFEDKRIQRALTRVEGRGCGERHSEGPGEWSPHLSLLVKAQPPPDSRL